MKIYFEKNVVDKYNAYCFLNSTSKFIFNKSENVRNKIYLGIILKTHNVCDNNNLKIFYLFVLDKNILRIIQDEL